MAGKGVREIVKKAFFGPRSEYKSGPWRVTTHSTGGPEPELRGSLYHYSTKMLEWVWSVDGKSVIIGTWIGHGSVSDQTGVNAALSELGFTMRYSRDISGGGPRINPRKRYA